MSNNHSITILDPYYLLTKIDSSVHKYNIRINTWEVPYSREVILIDYSLFKNGDQEDRLYLKEPFYYNNIRRGNTIIQIIDPEDGSDKTTFFARKGIRKFFEITDQYLEFNLKLINEGDFEKKMEKDSIYEPNEHFKLNKLIFNGVKEAYQDNEDIEVFKLLKANGENCQISWINSVDSWLIASKNVSVLCRTELDIDLYQRDRFEHAKIIAHAWFKILERIKNKGANISEMKYFLKTHTMIGEYVGDPDNQHVYYYSEIDILFFAIVNNVIDEECLPPMDAFKIFLQYHLSIVRIEDLGTFKNFDSLNLALKHLLKSISEANLDLEQEGCVLYFFKPKSRKVVGLAKLKTLEYKILRKLREKLRNFIKFYYSLKFEPFQSFYNEVEELCKISRPRKPLDFYYKLCQFSIDFVDENFSESHLILDKFALFLLKVLNSSANNTPLLPKHLLEPFDTSLSWSSFKEESILKYQFKNSTKTHKKPSDAIPSPPPQPLNKKKQLFVIVPIALPGMGKSFFIPYLHESIIEKSGSWESISFDKIRKECMITLAKENKNLSEEKLFENTGKISGVMLGKNLEFHIKNIRNSNKEYNFLFLDKNHPPNSLKIVQEKARKHCPDNVDLKLVALYPLCKDPKDRIQVQTTEGKQIYPFSYNFFFTCLYRVQTRNEHETLRSNHEKSITVMLMYLKQFKNCVLNEEELRKNGFDITLEVDLTAERVENPIYDHKLKELLMRILEQQKKKAEELPKKKSEDINHLVFEFTSYFEELNLEISILSKNYLLETARKCIRECLENSNIKSEAEHNNFVNLDRKNQGLSNKRVGSNDYDQRNETNSSHPFTNNLKRHHDNHSSGEKYHEEEKTDPLPIDRVRDYNPKTIPNILGIFAIDNNRAKPEILQFLRSNLLFLQKQYPNDQIISQNHQRLTKTFIFPRSFNVTTLMINKDKAKIDTKYFKTFQDGQKIKMEFPVLFYIPDVTLAGLYYPKTDIPMIETPYPYMTFMIGGLGPGPEFAGKALKQLFENSAGLKENYEMKGFFNEKMFSYKEEIVLEKKKYVVYLSKSEAGVVIEGEASGSVENRINK